jgi:hypothetical protein
MLLLVGTIENEGGSDDIINNAAFVPPLALVFFADDVTARARKWGKTNDAQMNILPWTTPSLLSIKGKYPEAAARRLPHLTEAIT